MISRMPLAVARIKRDGKAGPYTVVAMRHHPRNMSASLRDEYCGELAPSAALFAEFKALERASGDHNGSFTQVGYERRFWLEPAGLATLARLTKLDDEQRHGIALVCQCQSHQRCHVDLLLLMARTIHQAVISPPEWAYPDFQRRLDAWMAPF